METASSPSSSSSSSILLLPPPPHFLPFTHSYLRTLLPALSFILAHDSFPSLKDRLRATKFAVDMSLALSAAGNLTWKKALAKELVHRDDSPPKIRRSLRVLTADNVSSKEAAVRRPAVRTWEKKETLMAMAKKRKAAAARTISGSEKRRRKVSGEGEVKKEVELEEEKEAMEIHVQMRSLGGLVPGGLEMDAPVLLEEAADYLLALQLQVQALKSLLPHS